MKNNMTALAVGILFSLGLGISGMTDPAKVIGFLDIFGHWNPSLIFVMLGAIAIHFTTYKFIVKRRSPLLSAQWHLPQKKDITLSLVLGSVFFGFGWGLAGYCPGPAITSLAALQITPWIFVIGMLGGMFVFKILDQKFKFRR